MVEVPLNKYEKYYMQYSGILYTREPCKMQAIATAPMKPCHFVRLLGCSKKFCDVMMTSL